MQYVGSVCVYVWTSDLPTSLFVVLVFLHMDFILFS